MPNRTEVKRQIKDAILKNLPFRRGIRIHDFDIPKLTEDILTAVEEDCMVVTGGYELDLLEDTEEEKQRIEQEKLKTDATNRPSE